MALAVYSPIPGSWIKVSYVLGILPLYLLHIIFAVLCKLAALL